MSELPLREEIGSTVGIMGGIWINAPGADAQRDTKWRAIMLNNSTCDAIVMVF